MIEEGKATALARTVGFTVVGNLVMALGVVAFISPAGIICGGTTGISLVARHYLGVPISLTTGVLNVVALVAGAFLIGRKFAAATLVSSFASPFAIAALEQIPALASLTSDMMLSSLMAGVFTGAGVGLVLRGGASTGGTDVPVLLAAKATGISTSALMGVMNVLIMLMQLPFSNSEQILYGLVNTFVMSLAMDATLNFGRGDAQLIVISSRYEELRSSLLGAGYGLTLLNMESGMERREGKALLLAVPSNGLAALERSVLELDPSAFLLVSAAARIRGRGFSYDRYAVIGNFEELVGEERDYARP